MRKSIFICLLALWFLGNGCSSVSRGTHTEAPIPVEVTVVATSQEAAAQNYVGTIAASATAALSFPIPGSIISIYVKEGQRVTQGTLLAELNPASYQDSYSAAQATLLQAQDGYNRLQQLYEKGSIPAVQWVEIQTKLAQAQSAEAIARKNLENCKLYAPFDGVIGTIELTAGMNAMPGMTALTLLKINQIDVVVPIPENVISTIQVGQQVQVSVSALGNMSYSGKVDGKGVVANPLSHNYEITIPLSNPTRELMPGMVCNVLLISEDTTQRIALPQAVVKVNADGQRFVWIVKNGCAVPRNVVTNGLSQKGIVVSAGLNAGDSVITRGSQKVSTGMQVVIQ